MRDYWLEGQIEYRYAPNHLGVLLTPILQCYHCNRGNTHDSAIGRENKDPAKNPRGPPWPVARHECTVGVYETRTAWSRGGLDPEVTTEL